ncbi:FHA domain-containing protein [Streptomyces sp. NPDC050095]|uniref:FHA domain-containing protein n=1 Tax=unclassified Streptomyces TaxID=2593676 RepID=UPI003442BFEC
MSTLTVLSPAPLQGAVVTLGATPLVIGRTATCDLRLDDPCVSGTHAVIQSVNGHHEIEDLRSRNGTRVNGAPVTTSRPLSHRDVIQFGNVQVCYEENAAARNASLQTVTALPSVNFAARDQSARDQLNNIGGNQYNQYVQQIRHERDGLLRDVLSTRTRARWLLLLSLLLHLAGVAMAIPFARNVTELLKAQHLPVTYQEVVNKLMVPEWQGLPVIVIGGFVIVAAHSLTIAGIVLHLIAASRRRRLESTIGGLCPPPGGIAS